jgi:hypothetical protein
VVYTSLQPVKLLKKLVCRVHCESFSSSAKCRVSMPARNSACLCKGKEPPEKPSTIKAPSRATPPSETMSTPAVISSTPVTRSTTLAKKSGESKIDSIKPPAYHPPIPQVSPSTSRPRRRTRLRSRHRPLHRTFPLLHSPQTNSPLTTNTRSGKFPRISPPRTHSTTFSSPLSV